MKIKGLIIVVIGLVGWTSEGSSSISSYQSERGFLSIDGAYGLSRSTLLNQDGSRAGYSGVEYGFGLDLRIGSAGPGEFRFFARSHWSDEKGRQDSTSELESNQTWGGIKIFTNNHLFIGIGYGNITQNITSNGITSETKSQVMALGLGLEFNLYGGFYGAFDLWLKGNPVRNQGGISHNSFAESGVGTFRLIYSPPSTLITNVVRSR